MVSCRCFNFIMKWILLRFLSFFSVLDLLLAILDLRNILIHLNHLFYLDKFLVELLTVMFDTETNFLCFSKYPVEIYFGSIKGCQRSSWKLEDYASCTLSSLHTQILHFKWRVSRIISLKTSAQLPPLLFCNWSWVLIRHLFAFLKLLFTTVFQFNHFPGLTVRVRHEPVYKVMSKSVQLW